MSVTVTVPTAVNIKMRFPEFADIADATIEFAIEEARTVVTSDWTQGYNIAIMYLVAHYLVSGQAAASGDSGEIASESIGRLSITYKNNASSVNAGAVVDDVNSSSYGRRFGEIREQNFGGPRIV